MTGFIGISLLFCAGAFGPGYHTGCSKESEYSKYVKEDQIVEFETFNYYPCKREDADTVNNCKKTLHEGCKFHLKDGTIYHSLYTCPQNE